MRNFELSSAQLDSVLAFLEYEPAGATHSALDQLINAYTEHVPWESASRIAKRAVTQETENCPRWPAAFWEATMTKGHGGTCFESNYAFFHVLEPLGFDAYLTINNMGKKVGCHTAIVVTIEGQPWLVDAGLPLFSPLPLNPAETTHTPSSLFDYAVVPDGDMLYQIERVGHPMPNAFTLVNRPVDHPDYQAALTNDYNPGGYFLDRVVINQMIDGRYYRFSTSLEENAPFPYIYESFSRDGKQEESLGDDPAATLSKRFNLDKETITNALNAVARMF